MCRQIWCRNVTDGKKGLCVSKPYLPALSGTSCGNKMVISAFKFAMFQMYTYYKPKFPKWCINGACVEDEAAPAQEGTTALSSLHWTSLHFQDANTATGTPGSVWNWSWSSRPSVNNRFTPGSAAKVAASSGGVSTEKSCCKLLLWLITIRRQL